MASPPDMMVVVLFALQGLWGLFLVVLTWSMRRVLGDIEENTKETRKLSDSIASINLLVAGNFVTKPELKLIEERVRQVETTITRLDTRDEYRDDVMKGMLKSGKL